MDLKVLREQRETNPTPEFLGKKEMENKQLKTRCNLKNAVEDMQANPNSKAIKVVLRPWSAQVRGTTKFGFGAKQITRPDSGN